MGEVSRFFSANPGAVASLVGAAIAASAALTVFTLTQLFARRTERKQFLLPKLEELYLLLNECGADNARLFRILIRTASGDEDAKTELEERDELELYGHLQAKKVIMYIRLYFPHLSHSHQKLFGTQAVINNAIFTYFQSGEMDIERITEACGTIGHYLRTIEEEIILNRNKLLGDHIFPKRFRRVQQKVGKQALRPDGPPLSGLRSDPIAASSEESVENSN